MMAELPRCLMRTALLGAVLALGGCMGFGAPAPKTVWQTPKDPAPIPRRKPAPPSAFFSDLALAAPAPRVGVSVASLPAQTTGTEKPASAAPAQIEPAQIEPVQIEPAPRPAVQKTSLAPPVEPAPQASYGRHYRVVPGDSLYGISRRFGVPLQQLLEINGLRPPLTLKVGQVLRLPGPRTYLVRQGDTIYSIARAQGVDLTALVYANKIRRPYVITPGQNLVLPPNPGTRTILANQNTASQTARAQPAVVRQSPPNTSQAQSKTAVVSALRGSPAKPQQPRAPQPQTQEPTPQLPKAKPGRTGPLPAPPPRQGKKFIWPVQGQVLSSFGPHRGGLHNDGINIVAPRGTPVWAADSGVVAYAGTGLEGFGRLVLIKHAGGWVTAYAHNEKLLVERGEIVHRGQVIATVGTSGNVGRPQLHFEVRKGTRAINPAPHLARRGTASSN